ncbi:MAG: hypothetical protein WEC79_03325 [Thermomicrobiales bacterium]
MTDDDAVLNVAPLQKDDTTKGWASRHPKLSILLIAGVFYIILFGMCAFVFVLLLRG